MLPLFPETIQIAGRCCRVSSLLDKGNSGVLPEDILAFLAQWYDHKDHIFVQTSGSTGTPKQIPLAKTFIAASARRTLNFFRLQQGDKIVLCLPMQYIAGKLMVVRALLGGLDLYCKSPSTDFSFLIEGRGQNHFHFAAMVPNQVQKLLHIPESFSHIDTLLLGGSAISPSLEKALSEVSTACYIGYGMTESATHIALRRLNGAGAGRYYHTLEGISIALAVDGRLLIDMPGLEKPLLTNDLAEIAANGRDFIILGRADNVIISGGVKYIPEELEKKLDNAISYPFFISSVADDILGRKIVLAVEAQENQEVREEIHTAIRQRFSRYERPKEVLFKENFLRTATGKIRRIV